jgi:spermidine synthase
MRNIAELSPDPDLRLPNRTWGILLISILGLFLETLFIRWIGTEIRIFAYLQNTILVACFLGLGLGLFTSSSRIEIKQSLIPMTALLLLMAIPITRSTLGNISEMLSSVGDLVIWSDQVYGGTAVKIFLLLVGLGLTFGVLILIVDIFVPIGRILGRLMNSSPNPIWSYSVNILGSILGTWLFVLMSYFFLPPFIWFILAGIMFAILIHWSGRDKKIGYGLLAVVMMLSWFASQVSHPEGVIWSPYQKLVIRPSLPEEIGVYQMTVNNSSYQEIIDLSEEYVTAHSEEFPQELRGLSQYDFPLLFHPNPETFLVVGSGTGNDVAGALRHNVVSVTAVEIDPAIISVGRELHPEQPYSSPHVRIVNDDARSFFASTDQKFDVIAFGLLDSHTTTSLTNARLDHYVYTKESIAQAKSKLKEGGIVVLNFYAQRVFIADRMERLIEDVFGEPPLVFVIEPSRYGRGGVMFVAGDLQRVQAQLEQNPRLDAYIHRMQETYPLHLENRTRVITDDWPYLYLESARIPLLYFLLTGMMVLILFRSNKKWESHIQLANLNRTFWHFFFLGAAFLLLEVQNISKASVVLGNTWQVNAVIISGVLTMALVANWIAYRFPNLPLPGIYLLLVGTCVGLYFIDLARFGFLPYPTKAVIVGALTSLPMMFSGIVFIRSFAITADKSIALGANLIGALIGALLQSITFVTGIKALLLIVAGFYLFSLFIIPLSESKENIITEFAK